MSGGRGFWLWLWNSHRKKRGQILKEI
jgi:hypothetical protein